MPRLKIPKVIKVVGFANGDASAYDGQYIQNYDPEWGAIGRVWTTPDPAKAMHFEDLAAALEFWKTESKTKPLRPDGKPNRPMTALTIEVEDAPGERRWK